MGVEYLSSWGFVSAVSMNGAKIVSKDSCSIYKSLQEAVIYFHLSFVIFVLANISMRIKQIIVMSMFSGSYLGEASLQISFFSLSVHHISQLDVLWFFF